MDSEGPLRTCIGCRSRAAPDALRRLVLGPDGQVTIGRTLPGRGAWLHPGADCLELARRRRALPRAFRVRGEQLRVDWAALATELRSGGVGPMRQ